MCGGAALNISGLLTRLTADVDVLGALHANGELGEMPDWIYPLAAEVAEELGLERHWLNDAAASVTSMGLPREFFCAQRGTISAKDCKSP
jgi:hypothetical protein